RSSDLAAPKAPKQSAHAGKHLGIGREATAEEIAGWDIDIRPDGVGLPPGKGTVKQGEAIYMQQCAGWPSEIGASVARLPGRVRRKRSALADHRRRRRNAGERLPGEVDRLLLALCVHGHG